MTEHFNLIDLVQRYNHQREMATKAYRDHTNELTRVYREAKASRVDRAKASGFMVTVGLESVARRLAVPVDDLRYDYGRTMPEWGGIVQWLAANCKGSTMLFEPVEPHDSNSDSMSASNQHTFASAKSTLKGSYKSALERKVRTLHPGTLPAHAMDLLQPSDHSVDAALRKQDTISVWFEQPQDATLFKLTWS